MWIVVRVREKVKGKVRMVSHMPLLLFLPLVSLLLSEGRFSRLELWDGDVGEEVGRRVHCGSEGDNEWGRSDFRDARRDVIVDYG